MKRKIKIIIFIFTIITSISIILILNGNIFNHPKEPVYNNYKLNNLDNSLISQQELKNILNKTYYEKKGTAGFSSFGLVTPPSIYDIYWTLNIMKLMQFDQSEYDKINQIIKNVNVDYGKDQKKLMNIQLITGIYKNLNITTYDKNKILDILMQNYSYEDGLFFLNTKDDSLTLKLNATILALKSLRNMDINNKESDLIKSKLISMIGNDEYFTENNFENDVHSDGISIIIALDSLGVNINSLDNILISKRSHWIDYLVSNIYSNIQPDLSSIALLQNLTEVNHFFGKTFIVDPKFLEFLMKNQDFHGGFSMINDSSNIETHYTFDVLNLCISNQYKYPNLPQLKTYILDSINSEFVKSGNITFNIEDCFFGIALAKKCGFIYDNEKMKTSLNNWYNNYIGEDSSINSLDKLNKIYFIVSTYNLLEMDLKDKNKIYKSVIQYLDDLNNGTDNNLNTKISSYKTAFEIITMLNKTIPSSVKKECLALINNTNINNEIFGSIQAYKIGCLLSYIDSKNVNPIILKKINTTLYELYNDGGYKWSTSSKESDINSTADGLKAYISSTSLNNNQKIAIKGFLSHLKTKNGLFFSSSTNSTTDLLTTYNACLITTFYNH